VAGAYVVLVADEPAFYVERGGRSLLTFADAPHAPSGTDAASVASTSGAARGDGVLEHGLRALAEAVRAGRVPKLALERIDGEAAIGSALAATLLELGFHSGPRRLTLSA
jgi:ATP-dependent Lhr-like helicase